MAKKKTEEEVKEVKKVQKEQVDIDEIKEELTNYMSSKIDKEVSSAVDKATKKLIRHKNSIIIKRDITILILLIICFFLGYNLYNLSNINIDITKTTKNSKSADETTETIEIPENDAKDKTESSLSELTEKYGYLVDNIYIDEDSDYLKSYYKGELTDELKLYLSLNNVDNEKIVSEDGSAYLDENDLKEIYDNLFDGDVVLKSFKYGDLNFHYLNSKSLFIADGKFEKQKSNISKEIIGIVEDDDVEITTIEGIIKDNKLYSIISNDEIKKYDSKNNLTKYKDSLTEVTYYFNKIGDSYKLSSIEVK